MADCSKLATNLTDCTEDKPCPLDKKGPAWFALDYYGSEPKKLTITTNLAADVYMSKSSTSDPDNFSNDFAVTNITSKITLDAGRLGLTAEDGFSAKIFVNAIDEPTDELLDAKLSVYLSSSDSNSGALSLLDSMVLSISVLTSVLAMSVF